MSWESIKRLTDEAENVTKFVFTQADAVAEAVLYRYPTFAERTVICCSTMSGCPIGCRFCGSGDYFVRNLTAEEIVAQVEHCLEETGEIVSQIKKLQIMFMSMGEPMLNWKALEMAIRYLHIWYPHAELLVSTSAPDVDYGPIIARAQKIPTLGLQFSVHESTNEARNRLVPFKAKLTLGQIGMVGDAFFGRTGRHPFFNYCAHDGNTAPANAARLFELYDPKVWKATVSVVCERSEGFTKANDHQYELARNFSGLLIDLGFDVRVFDPAGQDTIGGGCGQLWFVQDWMKNNPDRARPSAGHGVCAVHAPNISHH